MARKSRKRKVNEIKENIAKGRSPLGFGRKGDVNSQYADKAGSQDDGSDEVKSRFYK